MSTRIGEVRTDCDDSLPAWYEVYSGPRGVEVYVNTTITSLGPPSKAGFIPLGLDPIMARSLAGLLVRAADEAEQIQRTGEAGGGLA